MTAIIKVPVIGQVLEVEKKASRFITGKALSKESGGLKMLQELGVLG